MWSLVIPENREDETITNAICTTNILQISNSEEVTIFPQLYVGIHNENFLIAIDTEIILLVNENFDDCKFLRFTSQIDVLQTSDSGNLTVCCLADGNIHGIVDRGLPVFNLCINEADIGSNKTFVDIIEFGDSFYLLCYNGKIYRLFNIDQKALNSIKNINQKENESQLFEETILRNIILRLECDIKTKEVNCFTALAQDNKGVIYIAGTHNKVVIQKNGKNINILLPHDYKGVKKIFNFSYLFLGLAYNGQLFEICPYTGQIFNYINDLIIENISLLENNNDAIEFLILTKPDETDNRLIKIIQLPSLNSNYEFTTTKYSWLVHQPHSSMNLYYLNSENINENNLPQVINMKTVSETLPEQRFLKLIARGHLDEAEEFGKQFNLNLEPVYIAKSKRLLMEISTMNEKQSTLIQEKFDKLLIVFKLIKNKEFFLTIREFEIPDRHIMTKYLRVLLENLDQQMHNTDIIFIKEQQLRLETLSITDPYECNLSWQKFVHTPNIVNVCTTLMKTDLPTACLIWKRHASSIIPYLNTNKIAKLLNTIPATIDPFNIIIWLRHFVPSILHMHPSIMSYIVDWSIKRTKSLQYFTHWPEVGLEFATNVTEIFEDIKFLYSDVRRQYESNMEKLKSLVLALQDLSVLKKSYNLNLTLDNYFNDSIEETGFGILQRVQLSNLTNLVKSFLEPILNEKGLSSLKIIRRYIEFLVINSRNCNLWLDRAIECVKLFHNENEKLESTLLILKAAPVPWPDVISPLLKLSHSSHPLAAEIQTEYELQTIKLMKLKYGWHISATDCNIKLVMRIIEIGLPDMIKDLTDLLKALPEIYSRAFVYCCIQLSRKGKLEESIKVLDILEEKQKIECYEAITNIIIAMIDESEKADLPEDIVELYYLINSRLGNISHINEIQSIQILRSKFDIIARSCDVRNKSQRKILLKQGINNILLRLKSKKENIIDFIWNNIVCLTNALNIEKMYGIVEILKMSENIYLSCAIAYLVTELIEINQRNYEYFIDLSVLLIVYHIKLTMKDQDIFFDSFPYPLACKLLTKASKLGQIDLLEIIEFRKLAQIGANIYELSTLKTFYEDQHKVEEMVIKSLHSENKDKNKKRNEQNESISVFEEVTNLPDIINLQKDPERVLKCLAYCFLVILVELQLNNSIIRRMQLFVSNEEIKAEYVICKFLESLDHLAKSKQYHFSYIIMQDIKELQDKLKTVVINESFFSLQIRKILRYILYQKQPNFIDALTMVLTDSNPECLLSYFDKEIKNGHQRINYLTLSEMYNESIENIDKFNYDKESRLKYYYFIELCKRDATLQRKTNLQFVSITQLNKELKNKIIETHLLEKLCKDFDWNYQEVLVCQVITVLRLQEPTFDIKTDALGNEEIVIKITENQISDIYKPYINEINNIELFATKLLHFIPQINFYFYELYLVVINLLSYINSLPKEMEIWKNILLFLKHKMVIKRRHRPGQLETDRWLKLQSESGVLPKISKYRFPFMAIVEGPLKDILDNEVSVNNCVSWFPLIKLHMALKGNIIEEEVSELQDYFCMTAVRNSISEYKNQADENELDTWHLQPINNSFLQSVLRLIKYMQDLTKILITLYYVTNNAADGADQVETAYECYRFACDNESIFGSNKKVQDVIFKIKRKYPMYRIQHLLHLHGLVEEDLLQLVENPQELINALYNHRSILNYPKPDINKVVYDIANLHNIDFHILQKSFLQRWLASSSNLNSSTFDDTFFGDFNDSMNPNETINAEFIVRAHYILSSWDPNRAIEFLISHIFPADGVKNTGKQLKMMECFTMLINDTTCNYTGIIDQKQYISLKCVHCLNQLGYHFTIEKFNNYDKINILKKIWQKHNNNCNALEIISYICLGYNIDIPQIWNGVLKQMINLKMDRALNSLVDLLSCKTILLYTEGLLLAWGYVLCLPFRNANRIRSQEQDQILSKNLFRIQACPLVTKLNLLELAEDCIRLCCPHLAAILIAFANQNQKSVIIKMVTHHNSENLKIDIIQLEESGILRTVINSVLKELHL